MSKERLNELWNKVKHIGTIDQFDNERMIALGSVFGEMRAEIEGLEQQNKFYRKAIKEVREINNDVDFDYHIDKVLLDALKDD